jgi:hypothetical protein
VTIGELEVPLGTAAQWLNGLVGAFIGAAANCVTLIIVDPEHFTPTTVGGWKKLGVAIVVSGGVGAALFLKTHPTPWNGTDRRSNSGTQI